MCRTVNPKSGVRFPHVLQNLKIMKYISLVLFLILVISCNKIEDCELSKHECKILDIKNDTILVFDENRKDLYYIKYNNDLFYPYTLCEITEMSFHTPTFILGYCSVHDHYYRSY